MARRSFKLKRFLTGALAILLLGGVVLGIGTLFTRDTRKISPLSFSVGGLDPTNGEYVRTSLSIYTKDVIACDGLVITPDFETQGTYQVFYYDGDGKFLGVSGVMRASDGEYKKDDAFLCAKYARIVITPTLTASSFAEEDKESKIYFWEAVKYAQGYTVAVAKEQRVISGNLFVAVKDCNWYYSCTAGSHMDDVTYSSDYLMTFDHSEVFEVKGYDTLYLAAKNTGGSVIFWDSDKIYVSHENLAGADTVEIPKNACYAVLESSPGNYLDWSGAVYAVKK